jgi:hypothetical protein
MASKVIVLPADDAAAAQLKLQEWLDKDDKILFIVIGNTNIAEETVLRADKISGGVLQEPQWVIHAPVREDVLHILEALDDPDDFVTDWEKPLAIAVSITDVIRDMIIRDGIQPTYVRIEDAFLLAELDGMAL